LAALSPREQGEVIALMPPSTRRGALKTLQPMRRREAAKSAQEAIAHKKESNGALSKGQHTVHREPRAREQTKRVVGKQCHMTTWQYVAMGVLLFVYVVVCVGFYLIELENSTELKVAKLSEKNSPGYREKQRDLLHELNERVENEVRMRIEDMAEDKQNLFRPVDLNNDGLIQMRELKEVLHMEFGVHHAQMTLDTIHQAIKILQKKWDQITITSKTAWDRRIWTET